MPQSSTDVNGKYSPRWSWSYRRPTLARFNCRKPQKSGRDGSASLRSAARRKLRNKQKMSKRSEEMRDRRTATRQEPQGGHGHICMCPPCAPRARSSTARVPHISPVHWSSRYVPVHAVLQLFPGLISRTPKGVLLIFVSGKISLLRPRRDLHCVRREVCVKQPFILCQPAASCIAKMRR